jgi:hypothetical protein
MPSVSSNLLPFSVDLNLGNKQGLVGIHYENMAGEFNPEILCFAKNCFIDTAV